MLVDPKFFPESLAIQDADERICESLRTKASFPVKIRGLSSASIGRDVVSVAASEGPSRYSLGTPALDDST